jgi:cellulose synthase (UDP-forming)
MLVKPEIPHQDLERPRQLLVALFIGMGAWYLAWRWGTFNPDAPFFSSLVFAAELFGFATALLHIFMCSRLSDRKSRPARSGLAVDVLVPSYNEPVDLVRKTLLAAVAMDYPHRTWLLDDGRREEMKMLATEVGCEYLTRGDNAHAKAGNLNNALAHTSGEFVAIFDADHAPRHDFLSKLLGYFDDDAVAFVQAPQDYFNLDSYQHRRGRPGEPLWTEQSLFFRVIQRGKDCWNAAFFCGSCAVIRRSSLDRIGGFATGTVTEDLHTSIRLHAAGFRSVYHAEPLAFGVAPESVAPFIGQRVRWGQGAMHVWRKEGILTHRGLSIAQRLNYFASVLTYFDGWQKAVFYLAPVVVLTTGVLPILTPTSEFLLHFVPYYLLTFWVFEEVGRGYGRTFFIEQYNMARFAAFAWATLALILPNAKFRVTRKGAPAGQTLRFTAAQWCVMVANLAAIPAGIAIYLHAAGLPSGLPFEGLVANVIWASINGGLALTVLTFTAVVQNRKRASYRFPVPLAADLEIRGERVRGTVDDISDGGFRFYGKLPSGLTAVTPFTGTLALPDGPMRVSGEVRELLPLSRGEPQAHKGFGASFRARRPDHYRLERFLFGSDLQWLINGYTDRIQTPLSRFMPARVTGPERSELAELRWNAAEFSGGGLGAPAVALVSAPPPNGGPRWVASFAPLPRDAQFAVEIFTRGASGRGNARLERVPMPDIEDAAGMHVYRLITADPVLISLPDVAPARREAA